VTLSPRHMVPPFSPRQPTTLSPRLPVMQRRSTPRQTHINYAPLPLQPTSRPGSVRSSLLDIDLFERHLDRLDRFQQPNAGGGVPRKRAVRIEEPASNVITRRSPREQLAPRGFGGMSLAALQEGLARIGEPCPSARTAYLVSVRSGDRSGRLTEIEFEQLEKDVQDPADDSDSKDVVQRLQRELRHAWRIVASAEQAEKQRALLSASPRAPSPRAQAAHPPAKHAGGGGAVAHGTHAGRMRETSPAEVAQEAQEAVPRRAEPTQVQMAVQQVPFPAMSYTISASAQSSPREASYSPQQASYVEMAEEVPRAMPPPPAASVLTCGPAAPQGMLPSKGHPLPAQSDGTHLRSRAPPPPLPPDDTRGPALSPLAVDVPEARITQLCDHVRDMLRHQSSRVLDLFRKWDKDGSKVVSYLEFEKAMSFLGIPNPADVRVLWTSFDTDSSGDLTYHELLVALQPSLASRNPTAAALDPNRAKRVTSFEYGVQEQADAWTLIDRSEAPTEQPYAQAIRNDQETADRNFACSLRSDDAEPSHVPIQRKAGRLPGVHLKPVADGGSVQEQLAEAMTRLATTRVIDVFRAWDSDESGNISFREFSAALVALGLEESSTEEMQHMFAEFDQNKNGQIDYYELKATLQPRGQGKRSASQRKPSRKGTDVTGLPPAELKMRKEAVQKRRQQQAPGRQPGDMANEDEDEDGGGEGGGPPTLIERVKQKMLGKVDRIVDTFNRFDADKSKTISKSEFEKAMHTLGFTAADASAVWSSFDKDGSGEVVYHELLAVLQPQLASKTSHTGHTKAASNPRNIRDGQWSYGKDEAADAWRAIDRTEPRL